VVKQDNPVNQKEQVPETAAGFVGVELRSEVKTFLVKYLSAFVI
jgi:hypothetical protein